MELVGSLDVGEKEKDESEVFSLGNWRSFSYEKCEVWDALIDI